MHGTKFSVAIVFRSFQIFINLIFPGLFRLVKVQNVDKSASSPHCAAVLTWDDTV
eukprot:SAG31_NODE_231_length_19768_cov_9.498170_18_plen_55_part_00